MEAPLPRDRMDCHVRRRRNRAECDRLPVLRSALPGAGGEAPDDRLLEAGGGGKRTACGERDAGLRSRPGEIPGEEIRRARAVLVDGHDVPASLESARAAREAGGPGVLDAGKVPAGGE